MISVGIITVSDRVFRSEYEDKGGPALKQFCERRRWEVTTQAVVPDEEALIGDKTLELAKSCSLILLTGGTGIAERDVTPEAIRAISTKELPGFGEVMRLKSFERFPHAILSRNLAAVVGNSLVICLPGSPNGAVECLEFVADAVPHAVELLQGNPTNHQP
jgi:molybdopterin adenylyltransferase